MWAASSIVSTNTTIRFQNFCCRVNESFRISHKYLVVGYSSTEYRLKLSAVPLGSAVSLQLS